MHSRALRSTAFPSLIHFWLRQLIRTVPSDAADDLLAFAAPSNASALPYIKSAQLVLVIINHCLCTPYPFFSTNSMNPLLCLSDGVMDLESTFDVSVELCVLLAHIQKMDPSEWADTIALTQRELCSSIPLCSVINRRVQLERTLRQVDLTETLKGDALLRMDEEEMKALAAQHRDWLLIALRGTKKEKVEKVVEGLLAGLSAAQDAATQHFALSCVGALYSFHASWSTMRRCSISRSQLPSSSPSSPPGPRFRPATRNWPCVNTFALPCSPCFTHNPHSSPTCRPLSASICGPSGPAQPLTPSRSSRCRARSSQTTRSSRSFSRSLSTRCCRTRRWLPLSLSPPPAASSSSHAALRMRSSFTRLSPSPSSPSPARFPRPHSTRGSSSSSGYSRVPDPIPHHH